MVEGSYNIGTEESNAKFLKAAKKSGVKEVAEAARTTTLVTPWICSRDELGRERVKLVEDFANAKGIRFNILMNKQVGETTLRLHVRHASSAPGSDQRVVVGVDDCVVRH